MRPLPGDHGQETEGLISNANWTPKELLTSRRSPPSLHFRFCTGNREETVSAHAPTLVQGPPQAPAATPGKKTHGERSSQCPLGFQAG